MRSAVPNAVGRLGSGRHCGSFWGLFYVGISTTPVEEFTGMLRLRGLHSSKNSMIAGTILQVSSYLL